MMKIRSDFDSDLRDLERDVLARSADAVFLLDTSTGRASHRWYDAERSRLALPAETGEQQMVTWVHPDDLPGILEAYAGVVNTGGDRTAFARIHPDRGQPPGSSLLVLIRDVRDMAPDHLLVQVWFLEPDAAILPKSVPSASMSSLADAAPVGLQVMSTSGHVSFENERFSSLAGPDRPVVDRCIREGSAVGEPTSHDLVIGGRSLRLRVVPTVDEDEGVVIVISSLEDVSQIQAAAKQFDALFLSSPLATALVGLDGTILRANESFAIIIGHERDVLEGKTFQEITHPDDLAADEDLLAEVVAGARQNYQMEKRYLHASGHVVWVDLTVAPVLGPDGTAQSFVAHVEDITSRRSMMELGDFDADSDLTYWALHDHLTALPNRRYLEHHLDSSLRRTRRESDRPVVLFLDLDDFKPVNDRHGHAVGDEVLRTIARRLRNACRDDAIVARYGGDEFVVVSRRLRTVADVPLLADRIVAATKAPIDVAGIDEQIRVGASVGIAVAHEGDRPDDVLSRADDAAYRAKRAGKGQIRY